MKLLKAFSISIVFSVFIAESFSHASNQPLENFLPTQCHFSADFVHEKKRPSLPVAIKSTGKIYFSCHKGLIWQTTVPELAKETLVLTSSEEHFRAMQNLVNRMEIINSIEVNTFAALLTALLRNDKDYLNNTFSIQITTENSIKKLILTPKSTFLKKGLLSVSISNKTQPFIEINQANDTQITITLNNLSVANSKAIENIAELDICLKHNPLLAEFCPVLNNPTEFAEQLSPSGN